MAIRLKRVYEEPSPADGYRVLVDRLWPRGMTKERAHADLWMREIAPTTELRRWYHHEVAEWPEFRERYLAELDGHRDLLEKIRALEKEHGTVTLVYGARDTEHNQADVIAEAVGARTPG